MAHFAELDGDNIVTRVLVVDNDKLLKDGKEDEQTGIDYLNSILGSGHTWKQTSYNHNFRKKYAGTGFAYDEARDAFIEPCPFPSWTINEDTCQYEPPIPRPEGLPMMWNESELAWEDGEEKRKGWTVEESPDA